MSVPGPLTVEEAATHHRTAMVVWAALFAGPALFAVAVRAVVETDGAIANKAPMDAQLTLLVWAVMAAAALAGAWIFRARASGLAGSRETELQLAAGEGPTPATVLMNLLVSWALAEGQLFLAMALYFMSGSVALWWAALALHAVALAGGFPQRAWFTGLARG